MILGIPWKYNNNFNNFLLGIPSMGIVSYGFASENNEILMLFHQFMRGKLSNNFPVFVFVCLFIYYYHSQIRIYNRMCKYGSSHIRLVFDFHGFAWEERGTQRARKLYCYDWIIFSVCRFQIKFIFARYIPPVSANSCANNNISPSSVSVGFISIPL